jgi:hypothetical protein
MGCPAGVSGTTSFLWAKAGLMIMTIKWQYLGALLASLAIGLAGCGSNPFSTDGVDTGAKAPAAGFEARSACGNESTYTIEGKSYQVMASAAVAFFKGSSAELVEADSPANSETTSWYQQRRQLRNG